MMDDIPWYSEASLVARGHVFCAGTLVQCVRKWKRLPELDQASSYINLAKEFAGRKKLAQQDVAVLAQHNDIRRV